MLRPAIPIAADGTSSLARAITAGLGQRFGEADPEAQFVHHDDIASAVSLAVDRRLDGVYNVAPDGSIPGDRVRALTGRRLRLPMPDRSADVIASLRWRFQRGPIPPGLRSYTRYPWIVANDKLRAEGWVPDRHERAGVRRGHRGQVVDDGDAEAPSGDRAGWHGRDRGRGHDRRRRHGATVVATSFETLTGGGPLVVGDDVGGALPSVAIGL